MATAKAQTDKRILKVMLFCKRVLLWGVLGLLLCAGGLVVFRVDLAQWGLEQTALQAKVPAFSARVTDISFDRVAVENITAGQEEEFRLGSLVVSFDLLELWEGGPLQVVADGLRLKLDLTGKQPFLGSLEPLLGGSGSSGASSDISLPFRPEIRLNDGALEILSQQGPVTLPFAAELVGTREEDIQGWVNFLGGDFAGHQPERLDLGMIFSASDVQLDWDIDWQELGLQGEGAAALFLDVAGLDRAGASWNVQGNLTGELPLALFAQEMPENVKIRSAAATLELDGTGVIPVKGAQPQQWQEALVPLLEGIGQASASLSVHIQSRVQLDDGGLLLGDLPLLLTADRKTFQIGLSQGASLDFSGFEKMPLPPEVRDILGPRARIEIAKDETQLLVPLQGEDQSLAHLSGRLRGREDFSLGFQVDAAGIFNLAEGKLREPRADIEISGDAFSLSRADGSRIKGQGLKAHLSAARAEVSDDKLDTGAAWQGAWQIALAGGEFREGARRASLSKLALEGNYLAGSLLSLSGTRGGLQLDALSLPDLLELKKPTRLELQDLSLSAGLSGKEDAGPDHKTLPAFPEITASATIKQLDLNVLAEPQEVRLSGIGLDLQGDVTGQWKAKFSSKEITAPALEVQIINLQGQASTDLAFAEPEKGSAVFDLEALPFSTTLSGGVESLNPERYFPPLTFKGESKGNLKTLNVSAAVALSEGATLLNATGSFAPERGDGEFDLTLPKLLLLEGGLQPETFSPLLSGIRIIDGSLDGQAKIRLANGVPDGEGYLNLDLAESLVNGFAMKGFEGRFFFQGIDQPTLPPGQSIRIAEIDAGLPVTGVELLWGAFLEEGEPIVELRKAGLEITGGTLALSPGKIPVTGERQSLELLIESLDVKELFELIGQDNLGGTGRLSGSIPMIIEGEYIAVGPGHLATDGPGVLRIRSEIIADALSSGGEQVELLVEALKDFHYSELTLDIEKPFNAASEVRLGISGANEKVLDGHPFRINVNLETRIEPLLEALLQGQKISQGLVSGFFKRP
ncbi:intermembrane phospholipid transport protein YdbH family protein [Kiloniella laminariae]|uniref:intermembrane phospholipid transport protein YdbH family protein n=1 Tax=Kiloniella laminariae TaxID=454162 RepID=UPI00039F353A|nr:YdbH domain-containing protein [Kiloniella laminariae]